MLRIDLLGTPRVLWNGSPLHIKRRQTRALLYRIASEKHPIDRERLCFYFWSEISEEVAKRRFTHLLHDLRKELPHPDLLIADPDIVYLNPILLATDLRLLESTYTESQASQEQLSTAVNLYRGDFLQGFVLSNCPEYEQWLLGTRRFWENRFLALLRQLIDYEIAAGKHLAAIEDLRHYLYFDELNEEIHRLLMVEYHAVGRRSAASRQYRSLEQILQHDVLLSPSDKTIEIYQTFL